MGRWDTRFLHSFQYFVGTLRLPRFTPCLQYGIVARFIGGHPIGWHIVEKRALATLRTQATLKRVILEGSPERNVPLSGLELASTRLLFPHAYKSMEKGICGVGFVREDIVHGTYDRRQ